MSVLCSHAEHTSLRLHLRAAGPIILMAYAIIAPL